MVKAMELHVGRGISAGALTVFPVWNGDGGRRRYSTDVGGLAVTELEDGPSVPGLRAVNRGSKPVLVLEGHLFEGGWQHRMATKSVILAPGRPEVVEVACVEQRRWGGGARQASRGRRATPYVRSGAHAVPMGHDAQGEVWRRVDTYRSHDVDDTGSLVGHLDRADGDVRRLTHSLRPLPGQAGVIVAIAGQPFMMEVFDDAQTLREQFDSIIAAAGLDALGQPAVVTPSRRARRMAERLERMNLQPTEQVEDSVRLHARDHDLDVSVLSWRGRPVHLRATFLRHPSLAEV
jgi:hypothetical protein